LQNFASKLKVSTVIRAIKVNRVIRIIRVIRVVRVIKVMRVISVINIVRVIRGIEAFVKVCFENEVGNYFRNFLKGFIITTHNLVNEIFLLLYLLLLN
jgi:hypothetical protein